MPSRLLAMYAGNCDMACLPTHASHTCTCAQAHYGKKDSTSVATIKGLYKTLEVEERFKAYENESHEALVKAIEEQTVLPKPVFTSLLKKIYKRSK